MISLPWMTQEPGVVLSYEGLSSLPRSDSKYYRIRLSFEENIATESGYIDMYIHPETFLLSGWNGTSAYPLLPGGQFRDVLTGNGPEAVRIVEDYAHVDGVVIPRAYSTVIQQDDGSERLMGTHLVIRPMLSEPFESAKTRRPANAEVVKSTR